MKHSMTTISVTFPTTGSGSPGSAAGATQGSNQASDGQPAFSAALSQAQGRDRAAQSQDSGAPQTPEQAAPPQAATGSKRSQDKTRPDLKHADQTAAGSQQGAVPVPGLPQNPQALAPWMQELGAANPATSLASGKTLPPGGSPRLLESPLSSPGLPQAIVQSAAGRHSLGGPPATGPVSDPSPQTGTLAEVGSSGKTLPGANGGQPVQGDVFQTVMSTSSETQSANVRSLEKWAQTMTGTLTQDQGGQQAKDGSGSPRLDAAAPPTSAPASFAATLMPGAAPIPSTSASAQPYTASLHTPVGGVPWGQELGQQLLFAVNGQQQLATLHLNPPQLGPLDVHLTLHNGQVDAQFVSPHQAVRQALESAMPQLHDLFTGAGLTLMQTSVNAGGNGRNAFQNRSSKPGTQGIESNSLQAQAGPQPGVAAPLSWKQGLVNTYV